MLSFGRFVSISVLLATILGLLIGCGGGSLATETEDIYPENNEGIMGGGRGTARPPSDCDKWNKFTDPTVHYSGPHLSLPLPAGYGWKVNTNPGFYTPDVQFHSGWYFHATDFGDSIFINGKLNDFDENVIDVLAAADGKVSFVENSLCANGGSNAACKLFVNHSYSTYGTGYETEYTHVVKGSIKVSVGERVKRGQVLAKLGKTGTGRMSSRTLWMMWW